MPETKERTVSLDEQIRARIDRRRGEHNLDVDQSDEVSRSEVINLATGLLFGHPPTGEDLALLEELADVDALVERTADSKGRIRLGGKEYAGEEFVVVAIGRGDE